MKQTAVEWLVEKLEIFATEEEMNIIEQAKAMEKEQIIEAWNIGTYAYNNGEQYYNETYEQDKQG